MKEEESAKDLKVLFFINPYLLLLSYSPHSSYLIIFLILMSALITLPFQQCLSKAALKKEEKSSLAEKVTA